MAKIVRSNDGQTSVDQLYAICAGLGGFAKLVGRLDAADAVTQPFKTYEGLHSASIEPTRWDTIQAQLQTKAAYKRGDGKRRKSLRR